MLGFVLLGPLVVAGFLQPDSQGHGTHQQMGLPPCTFVVLFDIRCPTCGMTTSWANLVRGRLVQAARSNLAGMLLCLADMLAVPWLLSTAVAGKWVVWEPRTEVIACGLAAILVIALIEWTARLACG